MTSNLACLTFLSIQKDSKYPYKFDLEVKIWWKLMITNQVALLATMDFSHNFSAHGYFLLCEIIQFTEKLCVSRDFLHHALTCRMNLHNKILENSVGLKS